MSQENKLPELARKCMQAEERYRLARRPTSLDLRTDQEGHPSSTQPELPQGLEYLRDRLARQREYKKYLMANGVNLPQISLDWNPGWLPSVAKYPTKVKRVQEEVSSFAQELQQAMQSISWLNLNQPEWEQHLELETTKGVYAVPTQHGTVQHSLLNELHQALGLGVLSLRLREAFSDQLACSLVALLVEQPKLLLQLCQQALQTSAIAKTSNSPNSNQIELIEQLRRMVSLDQANTGARDLKKVSVESQTEDTDDEYQDFDTLNITEFEDETDWRDLCCAQSPRNVQFYYDMELSVVRDLTTLDEKQFREYYDDAAKASTEHPMLPEGINTKEAQFTSLVLAKCEVEHVRRSLAAFEEKNGKISL